MTYITFDKDALEKSLLSIGVRMLYGDGLHGLPEIVFIKDSERSRYPIVYCYENVNKRNKDTALEVKR